MKTVVVTGPVCGGKSTLADMLADLGAALVDGDRLGHEVLAMPRVRAGLVKAFGESILKGEVVDRGALGRLVFHDPGALAVLNRLSHPALAGLIDRRLETLAANGDHILAVLEAAVYFLLPIQWPVDLVVTVTSGPATLQHRLEQRNGLSAEEACARIRSQAPLAAAWSRADLVVVNEGGLEVLESAVNDIKLRIGMGGLGKSSGPSGN